MADEEKGGGPEMGVGVVVLFFAGVFALWLFSHGGNGSVSGGLFGNASSTGLFGVNSSSTETVDGPASSTGLFTSTPQTHTTTPHEIESQLNDAHTAVERTAEELRIAKLWGVHSSFEGKVRLHTGSVSETDSEKEYLTLSTSNTDTPISLSGWTLESAVTSARATIPSGVHLLKQNTVNTPGAVTLEPSEYASVVSGDSPLGFSFHENACAGYLTEFQEFTPSLSTSCPYPSEEMKKFGHIALDDDSCYSAISRVSSCRSVPEEVVSDSLSSQCRTFLQNDLTYSGCVKNHQADPFFYNGSWHIYLGASHELWRSEREIIRLLDAEGKTVDVLEY